MAIGVRTLRYLCVQCALIHIELLRKGMKRFICFDYQPQKFWESRLWRSESVLYIF